MTIFITPGKKKDFSLSPRAQSEQKHPIGVIVSTETGDKRVTKTTKGPTTRRRDMRKRGAHDPDPMKVGRNGRS